MKDTGLNGYVYRFSVAISVDDVKKYSWVFDEEKWYSVNTSRVIKKMFLYIIIMFIMQTIINHTYKMGVIKQIDIKNRTYYFYNDMINIKKFDSNSLKIDKKS